MVVHKLRYLGTGTRAVTVAACVLVSLSLAVSACGGSATGDDNADTAGGSEGGEVPIAKVGTRDEQSDMAAICKGGDDINVGFSWGFSGNSWRKQVEAELRDEAKKCPQIKKVTITTSGFDLQKQISDINGLVAQGANPIIVMTDGGPGLLPALRKATQAGVDVMLFASGENFPGKPGTDYFDATTEIQADWGKAWGEWVGKVLEGKGNVVFLGGPAGNPITAGENAGFVDALKKYPGIKNLTPDPVATDWDAAKAQKAMAGLLTKYPKIDAVVTDYGTTAVAAMRAFDAANRPLVPMATLSLNQFGCEYLERKAKDPNLEVMTSTSRVWMIRPALRRAVAAHLGTADAEPARYEMTVLEDSTDPAKQPKCDKSLPPDLDLDAELTPEQLKQLFG